MPFYPQVRLGGSEGFATLVEEANVFDVGNLAGHAGGVWVLADNRDSTKRALGWVVAAEPSRFWLKTIAGELVHWPEHGLGPADQLLWLGESGGYVTSEPDDAGIEVVQLVGFVIDPDQLILFPPDVFALPG